MNCCDANGNCTRSHNCPAGRPNNANATPPEVGNFKIEHLGPDEGMEFWRTLLVWLAGAMVAVAVVSLAVGYGTERFATLIWTWLERVS